MLIPYVGTQWDCPSSRFNGYLYKTRKFLKSSSAKRVKPQGVDLLFSPTAFGGHYRSIYSDELATKGFKTLCNGRYVTRYACKSGYNYGGGVSDPTPSTSHCPAVPMSALLAKIKGEKVNLGLLSAEYRKTASSFSQAVHRLREIARAIVRLKKNPAALAREAAKRRKRRVIKNVLQTPIGTQASRDYLLVRYGLAPTVSDMIGALDALAFGLNRPLVKRTSKSASSTTKSANQINQSLYPGDYRYFTYEGNTKAVAYVEWYPDDLSNQMNRLGLTNLPSLAWELVPFSFVVDWFLTVGSTLQSLDALTGAGRKSCTATKREKISMDSSFPGRYKGEAYSRSVSALNPVLPSWKPSTNAIHIADSLALLRTLSNTPKLVFAYK